MTSKNPKTITERQASFRDRKKAEGFSEITVWLKNETIEKIAIFADSKGLSKGEAIDSILLSAKTRF